MFTPYTVQEWLTQQAVPLLAVGIFWVAGVAVLYLSARSRRASLIRNRSGRTEETLVEDLLSFGYDPDVARATYCYLQSRQNVRFPIVAQDDLDRDLGLDSEDLDQTIRDLLQETGRAYQPGLFALPLVTVKDLVLCIQTSPRQSQIAA